jgi:hypothetical protein
MRISGQPRRCDPVRTQRRQPDREKFSHCLRLVAEVPQEKRREFNAPWAHVKTRIRPSADKLAMVALGDSNLAMSRVSAHGATARAASRLTVPHRPRLPDSSVPAGRLVATRRDTDLVQR